MFGVELEEVKIRVRVDEDDEQGFAGGEKVSGEDLDGFGGFGEEAELVGVFRVAGEPGTLNGVSHDAEAGCFKLFCDADVALHVHECDGEEGAVFF